MDLDIITPIAQWCALLLEVIGIAVITLAALYSTGIALIRILMRDNAHEVYVKVRHRLGRSILLGLEFLIAADIIFTVAVDLTFSSVGVLALIVLVRTFLSFTLEWELGERYWPGKTPSD